MYQFQVKYMLNAGLKIKMVFKEEVESNLALTLSYKTMTPIIKLISKYSTRILHF